MNFLIVIPARGGSKGIPKKNIKLLNNKPLIQYTLDAAAAYNPTAKICVSTDSTEISNTVKSLGYTIDFQRPEHLATDTASSQDVLLHALEFYEQKGMQFDAIILLQPTSPFRSALHIKEAVELYHKDLEMVVSVKEADANPYYNLFEENEAGYLSKSKQGNFTRRQDCPKIWEYNGAIYVINTQALKAKKIGDFTKIQKYIMDAKSSTDIDTPLDWEWSEFLAQQQ